MHQVKVGLGLCSVHSWVATLTPYGTMDSWICHPAIASTSEERTCFATYYYSVVICLQTTRPMPLLPWSIPIQDASLENGDTVQTLPFLSRGEGSWFCAMETTSWFLTLAAYMHYAQLHSITQRGRKNHDDRLNWWTQAVTLIPGLAFQQRSPSDSTLFPAGLPICKQDMGGTVGV